MEVPSNPAVVHNTLQARMYLTTHIEIWSAVLYQVACPIATSRGHALTAPTRLAVVASHVLTSPERRADSDSLSHTLQHQSTPLLHVLNRT